MHYCHTCHTTFEGEQTACPEDGTPLDRLSPYESDLMGQVLDGRFRLDHPVGRGGMGTVFVGEQLSVGREVAVKILRSDVTPDDTTSERFFREARTISQLGHPNIVRLIDFGRDSDHQAVYLVMEFVEGISLADIPARGRLVPAVALEIAGQICAGLSEPHEREIVHRDLKPDNVRLVGLSDGTLQVKVLDFGIARTLAEGERLTETGVVCGTPAYMAPEQSRGLSVDPRTDLYSLGVILYQMLTGRLPFSGENGLAIMMKQVQEDPPPMGPFDERAELCTALEELVRELMEKEPADRPADAIDVRDRIAAIRREFDLPDVEVSGGGAGDLDLERWIRPAVGDLDPHPQNEADLRGPDDAPDHSDTALAETRASDELAETDLHDSGRRLPDGPETPEGRQAVDEPTTDKSEPASEQERGTKLQWDSSVANDEGASDVDELAQGSPSDDSDADPTVETDRAALSPRLTLVLAIAAAVAGTLAVESLLDGPPPTPPEASSGKTSSGAAKQPSGKSSGGAAKQPSGGAAKQPSSGAKNGKTEAKRAVAVRRRREERTDEKTSTDEPSAQTGDAADATPTGRIAEAGLNLSLALDGEGLPHVAYHGKSGEVAYDRWDGSRWQEGTVEAAGRTRGGLALALGRGSEPAIAVVQAKHRHLEVATEGPAEWRLEAVDRQKPRGDFATLAADNRGGLHVGYVGREGHVWYAWRRQGEAWNRRKVAARFEEAELVAQHVSTAVTDGGTPHLCFYDNAWTALFWATPDGGDDWRVERVANDGDAGGSCAIDLDADGRPVIAHRASANRVDYETQIIRRTDDGSWSRLPAIEQYPSRPPSYDLAVGPDGHPRLTYVRRVDLNTSLLALARWNGSRWLTTEISRDLPGQVPLARLASLAVDAEGRTHLVHSDNTGLHYTTLP